MVCTISRFCWHHTRFNNIVEGSCRWNLSSANLYSNLYSYWIEWHFPHGHRGKWKLTPYPQNDIFLPSPSARQKFPGAALEDGCGAWNTPPPVVKYSVNYSIPVSQLFSQSAKHWGNWKRDCDIMSGKMFTLNLPRKVYTVVHLDRYRSVYRYCQICTQTNGSSKLYFLCPKSSWWLGVHQDQFFKFRPELDLAGTGKKFRMEPELIY